MAIVDPGQGMVYVPDPRGGGMIPVPVGSQQAQQAPYTSSGGVTGSNNPVNAPSIPADVATGQSKLPDKQAPQQEFKNPFAQQSPAQFFQDRIAQAQQNQFIPSPSQPSQPATNPFSQSPQSFFQERIAQGEQARIEQQVNQVNRSGQQTANIGGRFLPEPRYDTSSGTLSMITPHDISQQITRRDNIYLSNVAATFGGEENLRQSTESMKAYSVLPSLGLRAATYSGPTITKQEAAYAGVESALNFVPLGKITKVLPIEKITSKFLPTVASKATVRYEITAGNVAKIEGDIITGSRNVLGKTTQYHTDISGVVKGAGKTGEPTTSTITRQTFKPTGLSVRPGVGSSPVIVTEVGGEPVSKGMDFSKVVEEYNVMEANGFKQTSAVTTGHSFTIKPGVPKTKLEPVVSLSSSVLRPDESIVAYGAQKGLGRGKPTASVAHISKKIPIDDSFITKIPRGKMTEKPIYPAPTSPAGPQSAADIKNVEDAIGAAVSHTSEQVEKSISKPFMGMGSIKKFEPIVKPATVVKPSQVSAQELSSSQLFETRQAQVTDADYHAVNNRFTGLGEVVNTRQGQTPRSLNIVIPGLDDRQVQRKDTAMMQAVRPKQPNDLMPAAITIPGRSPRGTIPIVPFGFETPTTPKTRRSPRYGYTSTKKIELPTFKEHTSRVLTGSGYHKGTGMVTKSEVRRVEL